MRYDGRDLIPVCDSVFASPARRMASWTAFALFLAVVGGGGLVDAVWPRPLPTLIGTERDREEKARREAKFGDGSLARQFERDTRIKSRLRYALLPYYAAALCTWFSEADPNNAIIGKDLWFFLLARASASPSPAERLTDHHAALLSAASKRLRALGTDLVVLPLPRKVEIYGDRLRRDIYRIRPELYPRFAVACRQRGVNVVDLEPIWRAAKDAPVYWKTDSHWSPQGALLAAEAAAAAAGILKPPDARATRLVEAIKKVPGDFLRRLGIIRPDGSGVTSMIESLPVFTLATRTDGSPVVFVSAPKTDDGAIVGTSFSADPGRFPTALLHCTDHSWWFGAAPGTGPTQPMRHAVEEFIKKGFPRILVWEIPAHYLFCGESGLDGLGDVITRLPTLGLAPIDESEGAPEQRLLSPSGKLQTGVWEVSKEPLSGYIDDGRFIEAADGTFSLRFVGVVEKGPVILTLTTDSGRISSVLQPGLNDVALPLLGTRPSQKIRFNVRAQSGTATIKIQDLALVTNLRLLRLTRDGLGTPAALDSGWEQNMEIGAADGASGDHGGALRVEVAPLPKEAYPVTVTVMQNGGARVEPELTLLEGKTRHSFFVPVYGPNQRGPWRVRISSATGKCPPKAGTSVAVYRSP